MSLVAYSSSDDDGDDNKDTGPPAKRARVSVETRTTSDLPPLPSSFHDLYATSVRASTSDDPSLHGGRKRITPHVVGNWPSHVYIEWYPSPRQITVLEDIVKCFQRSHKNIKLHSLLTSDLGVPLPLHISLSASLSLTTQAKDAFLDVLTKTLKECRDLTTFTTQLGSPLWAPNYDRSRWFLVLRALRPVNDELNLLLWRCNEVCEKFDLSALYKAAAASAKRKKVAAAAPVIQKNAPGQDDFSDYFHFSIGWTLKEPTEETKAMQNIDDILLREARKISVKVDEVKVKIGNTISSIPLSREKQEKKR